MGTRNPRYEWFLRLIGKRFNPHYSVYLICTTFLSIQPASPKLQAQKSPPGLRRAGFQDFVDWLW